MILEQYSSFQALFSVTKHIWVALSEKWGIAKISNILNKLGISE